MVRVEIDKEDLAKVKNMLTGITSGAEKALTRSINKSLVNVRTRSVKDIGKDINLKASRIKNDFDIKKTFSLNDSAYIRCRSTPPGLINFGARPVSKGVTVKIKRAGARRSLKHAFIADLRGNNQVAWRDNEHVGTGKPYRPDFPYGKLPRHYRHPITVLYGPRIADIFKQDPIMGPVLEFAGERISVNLLHEADAILNRYA